MKRIFADVHLKPDLSDIEQTRRMIMKAAELGYRLVAVPLPLGSAENHIRQLRSLCKEASIDFASRLDLKPKTAEELVRSLRKSRRRFEIICVMCESKAVARQAAKDRRVDLLNFPETDFRKRFFDEAEAELASKSLASIEIDVKPLLTLEGMARVRLLATLQREVAIAQNFRIPIVVSSGATDDSTMRKPLDVKALTILFDMDRTQALNAVSKNPLAIVKRNREKLSPKFIAPGIRLIRRGKDCP
ncbi:MAG: RNase P subunit p30 family protein [Nitrososphaerota archaeon]|nr:RNase P subunit p30 family protein [Nitrososphaerota archaeon]